MEGCGPRKNDPRVRKEFVLPVRSCIFLMSAVILVRIYAVTVHHSF
jgi:hypothetical protein